MSAQVAITHVPKDTRWPSFLAKHRFWRQLMGRLYFSMSYVQKMTFIHKHMPPQSLILKISSKVPPSPRTTSSPSCDPDTPPLPLLPFSVHVTRLKSWIFVYT